MFEANFSALIQTLHAEQKVCTPTNVQPLAGYQFLPQMFVYIPNCTSLILESSYPYVCTGCNFVVNADSLFLLEHFTYYNQCLISVSAALTFLLEKEHHRFTSVTSLKMNCVYGLFYWCASAAFFRLIHDIHPYLRVDHVV